jgi:hypothetical protein
MEEIVRNRSSEDPVTAVHDARRALFAARTARLTLRREPEPEPPEARRGVLARMARMIGGRGNPMEAEGILDLDRPGAAYDHGQFAVTEIGDSIWGGPSGRALTDLPVDPDCRPGPLWFLGAVEFLNAAVEEDLDEVAGSVCRRFRVHADLSVSPEVRSARTSGAMSWIPDVVPDLSAVPLTVWIDRTHLRAVSVRGRGQIYSLELHDVGARFRGFDWTRLSTFRTSVQEDPRCRPNFA